MALVVESTSTASTSNADDITVTKPSGVASGDLLLIIANGQGATTPVYATCSGFTQIQTSFYTNQTAVSLLYRIADASDVSASNYTVALAGSSTSSGAVAMLRVSGWPTGNPLYNSATASDLQDLASWTVSSGTISLSRPSRQLLIMAGNSRNDGNSLNFNNYTITSSDSNPTWTELMDVDFDTASGATNHSFFVAYAFSSATSTITGYSVDVSGATSGGGDAVATFLAVIVEPVNATVSNALFQTSPVTFSTLTGSTQEPMNDYMAISPNFPTQSGKAKSTSIFTNPNKPDTNWINTNKL